jgi:hypothetical protein
MRHPAAGRRGDRLDQLAGEHGLGGSALAPQPSTSKTLAEMDIG